MNLSSSNELVCDFDLACQMECAEGKANAEFVDAHQKAFPETGATWREVAGTFVMYDGVDSPCTQTFALGMRGELQPADLAAIEQFYAERGAPVFHEVCPLVDASVIELLNQRGYQPLEFSNVLYRGLDQELEDIKGKIRRVINCQGNRE